jgi:hypothetical protein
MYLHSLIFSLLRNGFTFLIGSQCSLMLDLVYSSLFHLNQIDLIWLCTFAGYFRLLKPTIDSFGVRETLGVEPGGAVIKYKIPLVFSLRRAKCFLKD